MTSNPDKGQIKILLNHFNNGDLASAEKIALDISKKFSNYSFIWKFLGVLYKKKGKLSESLNASYKALKISPKDPDIYNNIGNTYHEIGNHKDAKINYEKATKINNNYFNAYFNLGNMYFEIGKLNDAILNFNQAIICKPDFLLAYIRLGNTLERKNKFNEAKIIYKKAIDIKNNIPGLYYNLGNVFQKLDNLDEAINSYKIAINLNSKFVEAYNNLGNVYQKLDNLDEAINSYKIAINLNSKYVEAYNNLGNVYQKMGQLREAVNNFKIVISLNSTFPEAFNNLGNAQRELGHLNDSEKNLKKAINLRPNYFKAYNNLGNTLEKKGKLDEAISAYESTLKINPDHVQAKSQLLYLKRKICDFSVTEEIEKLSASLGINTSSVSPFVALSWTDNPEQQFLRSKNYAAEKFKNSTGKKKISFQIKKSKIKIGYLSGDFYDFPSMHLMIGHLESHNRNLYEIYAFSYGPNNNDWMNKRAKSAVDHFIDIKNFSDKEIIKIIRDYKIDISIDENGYTYNSRTGLFKNRLSPIQINFLGYPGTIGGDFIDYIIADPIVIPKNKKKFYSEKIIYLPHSYQPNDNLRKISEIKTSRKDFNLPEKSFVFCCFNSSYKISSIEFNIWMRVLKKIENSVLWLLKTNVWANKNLCLEAKKAGVNPNRIIFAERLPQSEHLSRHKHADLFLDTFNYNAHTTASDALWAGLPLVTKIGNQFASRVSASLLNAINLTELITKNYEEYEKLILELATNSKKLSEIKTKLLINRGKEPLFDTKRYTQNFEKGLQQAYDLYLNGEKPKDIEIIEAFD